MQVDRQARLQWGSPGTWLRLAALVGAYFALARLGLLFALSDRVASPIWPPAGLALAAGVLWGRRALPAVFVGATLVELSVGVPLGWSLAMAAGTTGEAALASFVLSRAGGIAALRRLPGVLALAGGAMAGAVIGAAAGTVSLLGSGIVPPAGAPQVLFTWFLGDVAGMLVVAPPILLLPGLARARVDRGAVMEWLAATSLVALAAVALFVTDLPIAFLSIPPLVWIAVRLGPAPTSLAILGLDAAAVVATGAGRGPFARDDANLSFLLLQAFALTVNMLGLAVAAIAADRLKSATELEHRVAERTRLLAETNKRLEDEVLQRRSAQLAVDEAQKVAHLGTWRWDITKPHAEWSPELFRIYGLDPAGHVPTYEDYLTRVHPDDRERVKKATDAVFNDHRPYSHDERVRRPDGSWRHLHTWASAVLDDNGKLVALVGTCQDITDQVMQENKFRGLLESAPDAMVIADAQGRIVLVNGQAERLFGYTRAEMLGQPVELFVPESARAAHEHHRGSYGAHPTARPMGAGLDLRARRKDGSEFPVEVSLSPLETPDGLLVSSAIRDISTRKVQERLVRETLERFQALAEASPIGICHTTPSGAVDYANKAWIDITGIQDYRDDELVRRSIHPDDQPRSWNLWTQAAKTGKPFYDDMRWVHPDGKVRLTQCRAVAVRDEAGDITGFVSTVEDITERRASEEASQKEREARLEVRRLREQADFKTNFLRTAAHELGTPLTPIKIQLRVLRDLLARRPTSEEGKAVTILERNVDRLLLLVRDLLESARLQSGRLKLNPRSMDLAHVVHDVVETFQEPAIQSGIALDAQVPREMAMVGDPDRITQVLYNLISNSMKFTPSGGRVHVQAEDLGDMVQFLVQDTGIGFSPEQGRNLFQPFSQVHDLMQTSKPGSGLGLYICRGIVEQHGGAITAYSEGPGRGARFVVNLPRVARPPAPTPAAEAQVESPPKVR